MSKSPPYKTMRDMAKAVFLSLLSVGFDPLRIINIRFLPRYIKQVKKFKKLGGNITHHTAILSDYAEQAGAASGHYFHQDLLVARFIYTTNPTRHIDIGSRVDGFVAHVATFRSIDVMDVRALENTGHPNITFLKADLMDGNNAITNSTDSLSCLHAIEHFGLGRYGDPIDPIGHIKGFNNMLRMVQPGGHFYISFPIGRQNEVHFNAHRVFHPLDIFTWAQDPKTIELKRFDYVGDDGKLYQNVDIHHETPKVDFGCGIYSFVKLPS